jgi:hypothetical protein
MDVRLRDVGWELSLAPGPERLLRHDRLPPARPAPHAARSLLSLFQSAAVARCPPVANGRSATKHRDGTASAKEKFQKPQLLTALSVAQSRFLLFTYGSRRRLFINQPFVEQSSITRAVSSVLRFPSCSFNRLKIFPSLVKSVGGLHSSFNRCAILVRHQLTQQLAIMRWGPFSFSRMNGAINSPFRPFHPCRRRPASPDSPSSATRRPSLR